AFCRLEHPGSVPALVRLWDETPRDERVSVRAAELSLEPIPTLTRPSTSQDVGCLPVSAGFQVVGFDLSPHWSGEAAGPWMPVPLTQSATSPFGCARP